MTTFIYVFEDGESMDGIKSSGPRDKKGFWGRGKKRLALYSQGYHLWFWCVCACVCVCVWGGGGMWHAKELLRGGRTTKYSFSCLPHENNRPKQNDTKEQKDTRNRSRKCLRIQTRLLIITLRLSVWCLGTVVTCLFSQPEGWLYWNKLTNTRGGRKSSSEINRICCMYWTWK